jgi:hypothetical protein
MAYCISVSTLFWDKDVRISKCIYDYNDRTIYKYGVNYKGKEDIWIMKNVHGEKEFFFKNGKRIFKSNMFSRKPLKIWEKVVENFFFNYPEKENSNSNQEKKEDIQKSYQFAYVEYTNNGIAVFPNKSINDETVIKKMKIGIFVDFVNTVVLENNSKINKLLFYDLISVEILDSNIADIDSVQSFNQRISYCLAIAKAFGNDDVRIKKGIFEFKHYKLHKYVVTWNGKEDMWILDGDRDKFYIENGNTEYATFPYINKDGETEYISILDRKKSIPMWMFTVDTFFYNSAKTLELIVVSNYKSSSLDLESESESESESEPEQVSELESEFVSESTSITISNPKPYPKPYSNPKPSLSCGCIIM